MEDRLRGAIILYKVIAKASCRVKVKMYLFDRVGVGYLQVDRSRKVKVARDSDNNGFDECALADD